MVRPMPPLHLTSLDRDWRFIAKSWPKPPDKLGYSCMEWLPASVPGHVHQDLLRAGVIADPFEAMAELGCQWIDEEDWIYETRFTLEPRADSTRRVLRFEGLDTVCKILLDGELIAEHDNMFVPLEVELGQHLAPGEHVLRVEFSSASRVGRARRDAYFATERLKRHLVRFDERAFVRKAQYMFGWDWGPRLVSAGLWRPVRLLEFEARLLDVHVRQQHDDDGSVELCMTSRSDGGGRVVHFLDGQPRCVGDAVPLRIEQARLWWPAGLGAQPLYELTSLLLPESAPPPADFAQAKKAALDVRTQRIGLRTIELREEPDAQGQGFQFVVNGQPIWAVGANWIPDHSFPSLTTRKRLEQQLRRALDMNMNMLRVWGGGLYESDDFYDLCDELGLLVWQDFPYACSYYPDDAAARAVAKAEAEANVLRLRNRASLALWCGNNENLVMFQDGWEGRDNHPPRLYGEHIYDQILPRLLEHLDPERPYVHSSPAGGSRANDDNFGDQHNWDVWHGRGDWKHYADSRARFSSEFGFASAPGPRTWQHVGKDAPRWPAKHPHARWHDKTLKGYDTFLGYVELHYPTPQSIEDWLYLSQLNQRDALRFGIEHYRRGEFCSGTLLWQLNDCWPAQSWALLDFDGDYKAAAFELRRLYAPALASVVLEGDTARVWTSLDNSMQAYRDTLWLEATSLLDGGTLGRWEQHVELSPGERSLSLQCALDTFPRDTTLLSVGFAGTTSYRLLTEPKHARCAHPKLTLTRRGAELQVDASNPVLDLYLYDPQGAAQLLDNFVTLPKPGRTVLRVSGEFDRLTALWLGGRCELMVTNVSG